MFLIPIFSSRKSGVIAKERLAALILSDRTDCPAELLEQMKQDLGTCVSRYLNVNCDKIELRLTTGTRKSILFARFPLMNTK